jgi:DNA gyrase subunit A
MQQTEKTGKLIALKDVVPEDELMMITKGGVIIRCPVEGIRVSGRNTQGVKLMNLDAGDQIVDVARVQKEEGEEAEDGAEVEEPATEG